LAARNRFADRQIARVTGFPYELLWQAIDWHEAEQEGEECTHGNALSGREW
jgi:hypothetical protein